MHTLVSPRHVNRWNVRATAAFASLRQSFVAAIYPGGKLTGVVTAKQDNWPGAALPAGCASITRYTVANPGGRVCADPVYTYLMHPIAAANGQCLVWLSGHGGSIWYFPPLTAAPA
jgi:hypothetical protein